MYSLNKIESVFDAIAYTVKAMKESDFPDADIDAYISEILPEPNYTILSISDEKLEECNRLTQGSDDFDDTWRDSYYASLMEDYDTNDDEPDDSDVFAYLMQKNGIWKDSDKEAYEGFDSCKSKYWDSSDDEASYWKSDHICDSKYEEPSYDPWD